MTSALGGVRVLDITRGMAGALATMVLADYGAEVVRVEPLARDPWWDHPAYLLWNRGKRSVEVDLASEEGTAWAHRLVASADVLVESLGPGSADRLGLGWPAVAAVNPDARLLLYLRLRTKRSVPEPETRRRCRQCEDRSHPRPDRPSTGPADLPCDSGHLLSHGDVQPPRHPGCAAGRVAIRRGTVPRDEPAQRHDGAVRPLASGRGEGTRTRAPRISRETRARSRRTYSLEWEGD